MQMSTATAESLSSPRYSPLVRLGAGVICGMVAGVLASNSLHVGFRFPYQNEPEWTIFLWGEHWVLRLAGSLLAGVAGGVIAGAIARRHGVLAGGLSAVLATLVWLFVTISGWSEMIVFTDEPIYISIGNKLSATAVVLLLVPAGLAGGSIGQEFGRRHGEYFDSRRRTLLGIRWHHFIWLPVLLHLVLAQAAWAGLYGFDWLKAAWRSGMQAGSMIPTMFVMMLWGTFAILFGGLARAYVIISEIEPVGPASARVSGILKFGIGAPVLAWALQAGIILLHLGLARIAG